MTMRLKSHSLSVILLIVAPAYLFSQQGEVSRPRNHASGPASAAPVLDSDPSADFRALSNEQIRKLIKRAGEKDIENDKRQRDYTFVKRQSERKLNGKGEVQSSESKTYQVMVLYGESVERLIAKDDKPLSAAQAAEEEERIRKKINKHENETAEQRRKELEHEEKDREDQREFVDEITEAYNFTLVGIENLGGRDTYVIDGVPRPGFQPRQKDARVLPKFRFRVWIDKAESQWVKLDAEAIDTISFGWFVARLYKGSRLRMATTRVNDEVWLPRYVNLKLDGRLALLKSLNIEREITFREYKKFRTDARMMSVR